VVIAQSGPLTTTVEAAATAVAAGAVLLSVAEGAWGLAVRRSRSEIEERALNGGYFGGVLGAVIAGADVLLRYSPL